MCDSAVVDPAICGAGARRTDGAPRASPPVAPTRYPCPAAATSISLRCAMNHGEKYLAHTAAVRSVSTEMIAPSNSSSSGDVPGPATPTHCDINPACSPARSVGYE